MIPPFAASGHRAIAIDPIGLGRSDKPTRMEDFTVARHVEWTRSALTDVLDLKDIPFVLHDGGGERRFIEEVPGCRGQPHVIPEGGGHFLQEDVPDAFLEALIPWLESTPSRR